MGSDNQLQGRQACYFITFNTVDRVDVFIRPVYKQVVVHTLNHFIDNKGLIVHAWCLMTNHLHLLVQAKGFGAIWLNLNGLPQSKLRMVPKTYWYRYRNRISQTPTMVMVTSPEPVTGSASHQSLTLTRERVVWSGVGRFKLLREFRIKMGSRKQYYSQPVQAKLEFDYRDV